MSAPRAPVSESLRLLLNLLVPLVPLGALLLIGPESLGLSLLLLGAAGISTFVLDRRYSGRGLDVAAIPLILLLGYAALVAPPIPISALIAGIGGLSLLYWLSRDRAAVARSRDSVLALMLPAAALALAIALATLLPAPSAEVGLAAGIVVAILLLIAWLYRTSGMGMPEAPSSY